MYFDLYDLQNQVQSLLGEDHDKSIDPNIHPKHFISVIERYIGHAPSFYKHIGEGHAAWIVRLNGKFVAVELSIDPEKLIIKVSKTQDAAVYSDTLYKNRQELNELNADLGQYLGIPKLSDSVIDEIVRD